MGLVEFLSPRFAFQPEGLFEWENVLPGNFRPGFRLFSVFLRVGSAFFFQVIRFPFLLSRNKKTAPPKPPLLETGPRDKTPVFSVAAD